MPHRACVYVNDEIAKPSSQLRLVPKVTVTAKSENRPVIFLFPGQGAQRPGMGQDVYDREPLYREIIDRCAALLEPKLGLDIRTLIHPQSGSADERRDSPPNGERSACALCGRLCAGKAVHVLGCEPRGYVGAFHR